MHKYGANRDCTPLYEHLRAVASRRASPRAARDVDGERAARALEADWRATLERNPGRVVDVSVAASARRVAKTTLI